MSSIIFSLVILSYSEKVHCQVNDALFVWVDNVELQPLPDQINIKNKKMAFDDRIEVLEIV